MLHQRTGLPGPGIAAQVVPVHAQAETQISQVLQRHPVAAERVIQSRAQCAGIGVIARVVNVVIRCCAGPHIHARAVADGEAMRDADVDGVLALLHREAEWEKAARGTHGRIYPWGDAWDADRCNTRELGLGETTPVGIFLQGTSAYGCLDMAGNVWEWTCSLWGSGWSEPDYKYPYVADDGRENVEASDKMIRVLRGGSFIIDRDDARCAFRFRLFPYFDFYDYFGFRVVVSPISPASAPSAGSGQDL